MPSSIYNPFVLTMVIIMLILLLAIVLLAQVVIGAAGYFREQEKAAEEKKSGATPVLLLVGLLLTGASSMAQDNTAIADVAQTTASFGGLSPTAFYFILGVVGFELLVIFVLLYLLRVFLKKENLQQQTAVAPVTVKPQVAWWNKLNKFRPVEQEAQIDTGHDYDGIRELDNRLPPWWLYGFYVTIIFSVVYLWRYHVSHAAPSSEQELAIAMQQADEQKALYLKKAANNVDENTVKLLTGAADLSSGQTVFAQNCAACHGKAGEGVVGPNLTDDYWLHGGSIKDVFKTVKYGWPEKGMRSWKDDLSPVQIAQVASYIKSLHGTNPPNAKEKQGELFKDDDKVAALTEK